MDLTLRIPDDLATRLGAAGDLRRRALEALAGEEYRAGRLTRPELSRLLGFATNAESDHFLNARGIDQSTILSLSEQDRQARDHLHPTVARFRAFRTGKTLGGLDPVTLIRDGRR